MDIRKILDEASEKVVPILEKATEMRFFMHLLCVALYLEIGLFIIFHKEPLALTWDDFEKLSPAQIAALLIGYFTLMGYVFRVLYAVVGRSLGWGYGVYFSSGRTRYSELDGWVHRDELIRRSYERKDPELMRQVENRKDQCSLARQETRDMAHLAFSALTFLVIDALLISGGLIDGLGLILNACLSGDVIKSVQFLLLSPLILLILSDVVDDEAKEDYVEHKPIYKEIEDIKWAKQQELNPMVRRSNMRVNYSDLSETD